jgi:hypothetical protein
MTFGSSGFSKARDYASVCAWRRGRSERAAEG